jgi:hypothetical protein
VSVFYTGETDDVTIQLATFFNAIKDLFPSSVSWQIPASGDKINDTDGTLAGSWSGGTAASNAGSTASAYVAGTGAYVRWLTGAVVAGHKLQGRTFLCPLITSSYASTGEMTGSTVTTLQNAANTLQASNKLLIWHRPTTKAAANGTNRLVNAATVPNQVTSLRTRRT